MNVGGDSINVYAEAKTEYTRQLCQILSPAFQIYFLDLLKVAKDKEPETKRLLWNFQALLQEIPDWNQDKVLRETEKIQRDSNCDYLEELLTAVFIAHTKVLSAIRITTKQKKLQITIPKLDHFIHRTLRETGRLLWNNAFLFAEQGSSMDRQKNMRQVEALIVEGIQQSIRSLLPVKTILREYLNDDEGEGEGAEDEEEGEAEVVATKEADVKPEAKEIETKPEPVVEVKPEPEPEPLPEANTQSVQAPKSSMKSTVTVNKEAGIIAPVPEGPEGQQTLVVDTEPTVSFTNMDTIFDSNDLEGNEIATHSMFEGGEVERIETIDAPPEPIDGFEDLDTLGSAIDFEEITA
jgi:Family of unknown function (DUF5764)